MSEILPQTLLSDDGLIFISIDDNQMHYLRCLLDEVFGKENFIQNFVVYGKGKDSFSRTMQQYILCYAKTKKMYTLESYCWTSLWHLNNPDNDSRGEWFSGTFPSKKETE